MTRERSFVATYRFSVPEVTTEVERCSWYAKNPATGEDVYLGCDQYGTMNSDSWVQLVRALGGVVYEKKKLVTETSRADAGFDDLRALNGQFGEHGASGAIYVDLSWGHVRVTTPSRLKQSEHIRRRALVEEALRAHGVEFSLECATEHSDLVCRPINLLPVEPEVVV